MSTIVRNKALQRILATVAVIAFLLAISLGPFIVWGTVFWLWNRWAESAGWSAIIPINWKSMLSAVLICWFLRWVVCRKSS